MKRSTAVYLIFSVFSQLAARCYGQFLGSSAMGTALSNAGGNIGGYGAETTAMGMASTYLPSYGSGSYGFGSAMAGPGIASGMGMAGGCCNNQPVHLPSSPYAHSILPTYQTPPIYGPPHPSTFSPIVEPHHNYPMNYGSPYLSVPPPTSHITPGSSPIYSLGIPGMGYNSGALAMGYGSTAGGSAALATGSASGMGYGQSFNMPSSMGIPPPMTAPPPIALMAQPQTLNENENANTNININNEMGAHHSLIPRGLMGLTRM